MGVNQLAGTLSRAYEHRYLGLVPDVVDGTVTLSMDFEPRDSQTLAENINFWVLNEDGLRRVASGARPEDVNIATGGRIQFGPSRGTLRAVFTPSGRGQYTVIVYNNSDVPAKFLLTAEEALLEDESGSTTVPGSLP
ncbi:MAG: hypothetical protein HC802_06470 [Caldilineaceae bacterium]|nr:hypothetical protein [Caldilineaceae bacterium]